MGNILKNVDRIHSTSGYVLNIKDIGTLPQYYADGHSESASKMMIGGGWYGGNYCTSSRFVSFDSNSSGSSAGGITITQHNDCASTGDTAVIFGGIDNGQARSYILKKTFLGSGMSGHGNLLRAKGNVEAAGDGEVAIVSRGFDRYNDRSERERKNLLTNENAINWAISTETGNGFVALSSHYYFYELFSGSNRDHNYRLSYTDNSYEEDWGYATEYNNIASAASDGENALWSTHYINGAYRAQYGKYAFESKSQLLAGTTIHASANHQVASSGGTEAIFACSGTYSQNTEKVNFDITSYADHGTIGYTTYGMWGCSGT